MSFYMLPAGGKNLHNRASPVEMRPFWCCAPPFPRRGNFTLRSVLELISTPMESAAKTSPSGEGAAEGGRRGAFPTPAGRLYGFIQTGGAAAHHHPLNPLHLLNPLNPHARKGVSISPVPHTKKRTALAVRFAANQEFSFPCPVLTGSWSLRTSVVFMKSLIFSSPIIWHTMSPAGV